MSWDPNAPDSGDALGRAHTDLPQCVVDFVTAIRTAWPPADADAPAALLSPPPPPPQQHQPVIDPRLLPPPPAPAPAPAPPPPPPPPAPQQQQPQPQPQSQLPPPPPPPQQQQQQQPLPPPPPGMSLLRLDRVWGCALCGWTGDRQANADAHIGRVHPGANVNTTKLDLGMTRPRYG